MSDEYRSARKSLARHLWFHHSNATGEGRLEQRISDHDELHFLAKQHGIELGHRHERLGGDETLLDVAHRYWREGEAFHGPSDTGKG